MENMMDLEVFKGYEVEVLFEFKELMGKLVKEEKNLLIELIMDEMDKEFLEVWGEFCAMAGG